MKHVNVSRTVTASLITISALLVTHPASAAGERWSIVPQFGVSLLGDQSPDINADGIAAGRSDIEIDQGFNAGLGLRYDYVDSRWTSEFGWEYRSNDATTTAADGTTLPDGNYASNTFYVNGRYALTTGNRLTPWVGGGLTWIQEIDLDSEEGSSERSFSDSGAVGFQLMAGVDYALSDRFYLSGELRYSSQRGLDLDEENGSGRVTGINYEPVTLGLGIGYRF